MDSKKESTQKACVGLWLCGWMAPGEGEGYGRDKSKEQSEFTHHTEGKDMVLLALGL